MTMCKQITLTVTKTIPISAVKLWKWLISDEGMAFWLKPLSQLSMKPKATYEIAGGIFGEIRTLKAPERIRMTWQDTDWEKATTLQVFIVPRSKNECLLVFNHDDIPNPKLKEGLRAYWRSIIDGISGSTFG